MNVREVREIWRNWSKCYKVTVINMNKPRDLKYNMVTMGNKTVLNSTILQ